MMLDFLFYKMYRLGKKSSDPSMAPLIANMFVTIVIVINLVTIVGALQKLDIIDLGLLDRSHADNGVNYLYVCIVSLLLACYFFINARNKKIILKYENERHKDIKSILVFVYILASIAMFIVSANIEKSSQL